MAGAAPEFDLSVDYAVMQINKPNFYLFTGGPGAGKTTLLNALKANGYTIVPEAARAIIRAQNKLGGHATHNGDRIVYRDLMLQHSIDDFLHQDSHQEPVFFDRGIPDLYSYTQRFCEGDNNAVNDAVKRFRYHRLAFIFPPWAEIYCHDEERKQSFDEAIATYEAVLTGYKTCGYELVTVPPGSIEERVKFILFHLA